MLNWYLDALYPHLISKKALTDVRQRFNRCYEMELNRIDRLLFQMWTSARRAFVISCAPTSRVRTCVIAIPATNSSEIIAKVT